MVGNGSRLNNGNGIKNQRGDPSGIYSNPIQSLAKQGIVRCQDLSQDEAWGRFAFRASNFNPMVTNQIQSQSQPPSTPSTSTFNPNPAKFDPRNASSDSPRSINMTSEKRIPDGFGGFILDNGKAKDLNSNPNFKSKGNDDVEGGDWKVVGSGRKKRSQHINAILPKQQQVNGTNGNLSNQRNSSSSTVRDQNRTQPQPQLHPNRSQQVITKTNHLSLTPGQFLTSPNQSQVINQNPLDSKKINHSKSLKQISRNSLPMLTNSFNKMVEKCHLSPKTKSTSFSVGQVRNLSGSLIGQTNLIQQSGTNSMNTVGGGGTIIGTKVSPFGFGFQMSKGQFNSPPQNFHFPRKPSSTSSFGGSQVRSQGSFSSSIISSSQKFNPTLSSHKRARNVSTSTLSNSVYSKSSSHYSKTPSQLARATTLVHMYDTNLDGSRDSFSENELGAPFTLEDSPYSICLREIEDGSSVGSGRSFNQSRIGGGETGSVKSLKVGQIWNGNGSHELRVQALNQLQLQHRNQSLGKIEEKKFSYAAIARLASDRDQHQQAPNPNQNVSSWNLQNRAAPIANPNAHRFPNQAFNPSQAINQQISSQSRIQPQHSSPSRMNPNPIPNPHSSSIPPVRLLPQSLMPSSPSLTVASNSSTSFLKQPKNPNLVDRSFPMHGSLSQSSNDSNNGRDGKKLHVVSQVEYSNRTGMKEKVDYKFPDPKKAEVGNRSASGSRNSNQIIPFQPQSRPVHPGAHQLQQPQNSQRIQTAHPMTNQQRPVNQSNGQRIYYAHQPISMPSHFQSPVQISSTPSPQLSIQNRAQAQSQGFTNKASSSSGASSLSSVQAQNQRRSGPPSSQKSQGRPNQNSQLMMASQFTSSPISISSSVPSSPMSSSTVRPRSNLIPSNIISAGNKSSNVGSVRVGSSINPSVTSESTPRMSSAASTPRATPLLSSQSSTRIVSSSSKLQDPTSARDKGMRKLVEGEIDEGERSEDEAGKLWRSLEKKLGTNLDCGPTKKETPKPVIHSPSPIKKVVPTKKVVSDSKTPSPSPSTSALANRRKVVNVPKPIEVINPHAESSKTKKSISEPPKSAPLLKTKTVEKHNEILKGPVPQSAGLPKKTFSSIPMSAAASTSTSSSSIGSKKNLPPSRIPRPIKRIQTGTSKMQVSAPSSVQMSRSNSKSSSTSSLRSNLSKEKEIKKVIKRPKEEEEIFVLPCQLKEIRSKSSKVIDEQDAVSTPSLILSPRRGGISISTFQTPKHLGLEFDDDLDLGAKNLAKAFAEAELELEKVDITLSKQKKLREELESSQDSSSGDDFSQDSGSESSSDEDRNGKSYTQEENDRDSDDELNQIVLRFPSPILTTSRKSVSSMKSVPKKSSNSSLSSASSSSSSSAVKPSNSAFKSQIPSRLRISSVKKPSQSIVSLLRTDSVMKNSETDFSNDKVFRDSGDYVKVPVHWSRKSWKERKEIHGERIEE